MSKSVLVIDTPENCIKCEFSARRLGGKGRCALNKDCGNVIPDNGKPDWCPLKELPEKKIRNELIADKEWGCGFASGYNYCIDEILKEVFENPIPYSWDNIGSRD